MHIKLANGLTMSVQNERGHYAGEGTREVAFWNTDGTGPAWIVPSEFAAYSADGEVCGWVPTAEVDAYIATVGIAGLAAK